MALWAKAQQLPPESMQQIRGIYAEHFPIEVRHYLAQYIEEKFWSEVEPVNDNPQFEQYVAGLVHALFQEIETKASSVVNDNESFLIKLKLAEAAKYLRQTYSATPMRLYNYIRSCLASEMRLIQSVNGGLQNNIPGNLQVSNSASKILLEMEVVRNRTMETAEELRRMEQDQEAFALQYHECTKINAHIQQNLPNQPMNPNLQNLVKQKEKLESILQQKVTHLMQFRLALAVKLKETYEFLNNLQSRVLDEELIQWKREQQLSGNGAIFNSNLDAIQEWCESLAELIWQNRQQIKEMERLKQKLTLDNPGMVPDVLPQLLVDVTQLLSSLVTSTFIIEKQPPQVMKTNTRFTATVRLLVGGKLNVHMTPPQVKVTIISESQANILLKNDKLGKSGDASGEILNNTGTMEYQQATRQLSVSFRNMQLKKIKRAEKKGTESVMDEKFSLLFQSQFSVGGGELMFQVWTLSLPVVVIVHGNQEPHAWATVTWDNAFSEGGRVPFTVPEKVQWNKIAETLSVKFRAATGRPLTDENLSFLGEKAFRGNFTDATQLLSWAQFCKEPLPERNFTFWEWFYAVMKLTREHLRGPWVDGAILGFIRKKQTEEMLSSCPHGTFLLRFSDSELGGVTIAWLSDSNIKKGPRDFMVSEKAEVYMLQPFTSKDFSIRSLADRISDLGHLTYLYPDIPKDSAFNRYYTPFPDNQPQTTNGYVKGILKTHVPALDSMSYPNTPQHTYMQSPDPSRDTPSVASSYAGSVATVMTADQQNMEFLDQFPEDFNLHLTDFMQGFRQC